MRENLKLTHGQRLEKLVRLSAFASELRKPGQQAKADRKRTVLERSIRKTSARPGAWRCPFYPVGGVAGIVHAAARLTYDVDVVYERSAVARRGRCRMNLSSFMAAFHTASCLSPEPERC